MPDMAVFQETPSTREFLDLREIETNLIYMAADHRLKFIDLSTEKREILAAIAHDTMWVEPTPDREIRIHAMKANITKVDGEIFNVAAIIRHIAHDLVIFTIAREKLQQQFKTCVIGALNANRRLTDDEKTAVMNFVVGREYWYPLSAFQGFELVRRSLHRPTEIRAHMAPVSVFFDVEF
ncbi:hypothetical protein P280DRAFT_520883 [Massarina eburnea CBS 473.64]|uniref:Uncharacterized protein n=1 Tax=Massarina eburnea CBS 473.64 TaxID=1395130 RepID=A0A6A6RQ80_9PLEO|nr:hypothetical protein P280DRAFT_520883 [Massarina eburnea CBS 473.64]